MMDAVVVAHGDDAAVAATEPAAHNPFDRNLARSLVFCGRPCSRGQHALWPTGVHHEARGRAPRQERPLERRDNVPAFAETAVLRRQHQVDAEGAEEIEVEELGRTSRAIEKRAADAWLRSV